MSSPHRFLGFGFAGADLLLEIKPDGRVTFGLGAGESVVGVPDTALSNKPWTSFVAAEDHGMVEAMFAGMGESARAGPIVVGIATPEGQPPRFASLTAIRLPQNQGSVSCALARATGRGPAGLHSRDSFESRAAELLAGATQELELAFIELGGLGKCDIDPNMLQALVAGILRAQAYRGEAPTALGTERYAMIRAREDSVESLVGRIDKTLANAGVRGISTGAAAVPMTGLDRPRQVTQALRFALNQVMEHGLEKALPGDFAAAFEESLRSTLSNAGQLGAAIKHKRFSLAYQPVVSLSDGSLQHHEVLVRFGAMGSPFPTIKLAEELELIESLDVAILEETLTVLNRTPDLILAVNVSGRSLMSDSYVDTVLRLVRENPNVQGRLMFELTESAAVEDLVSADRRLQAMRAVGCKWCLDDFGAGAASLAYLQQLTLDLLKIDGRYIRDLQHGGREATFVKHLVNMCAELKVQTLAEMVETAEAEDAVRRAGVDFAQGWLYGRATEAPVDAAGLAASRGLAKGDGRLATRMALQRKLGEWG